MNKYIDAEKLIAEIERRKDVHRKNYEEFKDERFINDECEDDRILVLIDALQQEQPEMDLEKEVEHWRNMMPIIIGKKWLSRFARHFWNKGYNARKDDNR